MDRIKMLLRILILGIAMIVYIECTVDFSNQGSDWTMDSCNSTLNTAQSPINIITSTAISNPNNKLKLDFNSNTKYVTLNNTGFTL